MKTLWMKDEFGVWHKMDSFSSIETARMMRDHFLNEYVGIKTVFVNGSYRLPMMIAIRAFDGCEPAMVKAA